MNIEHLLRTRNRERSELLKRIVDNLLAEHSVSAAWLSGSASRGSDDALSDLDIHIVVDDQAIRYFMDNRRMYASEPAQPVLLMDNFANAPVGGAYLLALYEGEFGPQHVDWFWQPVSKSYLPDDEKILFSRVELPWIRGGQWRREAHRPPGPPLSLNPTRRDLLTHKIAFFWAMSLIVAKYIARGNGGTVARMTRVVARALEEIAALIDADTGFMGTLETQPSDLEAASAEVQFRTLRSLAQYAEVLGNQIAVQGAETPSEAIIQIYRFFCFAEALAARSWQT